MWKGIVLGVLLVHGVSSLAQQIGVLPEIVISRKWSDDWKATVKAEAIESFYAAREDPAFDPTFLRTDITAAISHAFHPLWKAGGGVMLRLTPTGSAHRLLQQVSYLQRLPAIRLGHRFRTDQTFAKDEAPEYRFRYRIASEFPLQGTVVDPREWYLVASIEVLYSRQSTTNDLENRLVPSIGYLVNDHHQWEVGVDYRLDRYLTSIPRHRMWVTFSWFVSL